MLRELLSHQRHDGGEVLCILGSLRFQVVQTAHDRIEIAASEGHVSSSRTNTTLHVGLIFDQRIAVLLLFGSLGLVPSFTRRGKSIRKLSKRGSSDIEA